MSIYMTNVNISLKEEAYCFLKSLKTKDKSFSDIILEFKKAKGNKSSLMSLFGALHDMDVDWNTKEESMKGFRTSFNKRIEKIRK